jgi:thiamine pyrophosphokinase
MVCAIGGRLDHSVLNIRLLRSFYKKVRPFRLHTATETLTFVKDDTFEIHGRIGDPCAVLAFPAGRFSSTGLKYNGNDFPLVFGESESTSNNLSDTLAKIEIKGEALVVQRLDTSSFL